jgi:hypothetical protein
MGDDLYFAALVAVGAFQPSMRTERAVVIGGIDIKKSYIFVLLVQHSQATVMMAEQASFRVSSYY